MEPVIDELPIGLLSPLDDHVDNGKGHVSLQEQALTEHESDFASLLAQVAGTHEQGAFESSMQLLGKLLASVEEPVRFSDLETL